MNRRPTWLLVIALSLLWTLGAAAQDDEETLREQQAALAAEAAAAAGATVPLTPRSAVPAPVILGGNGILFVGVDDSTVSTYVIDPADNNTQPVFSGSGLWGAAVISGANPGDAVIYFINGSTLLRYQDPGPPTTCCTLMFNSAASAEVSATYNPNTGRLLFTKNIATEAVYSLPVTAGSCPANCDLTQDFVYSAANNDIGGIAYDAVNNKLYGTNDDTSPGPAGVYEILGDGSTSLVVAYPNAETDIDGLAYDNGRLYLVTDQPGSIYVYNLGTASFETPLTNPWTTSETFSGAAIGTGLVIPVELTGFTVE